MWETLAFSSEIMTTIYEKQATCNIVFLIKSRTLFGTSMLHPRAHKDSTRLSRPSRHATWIGASPCYIITDDQERQLIKSDVHNAQTSSVESIMLHYYSLTTVLILHHCADGFVQDFNKSISRYFNWCHLMDYNMTSKLCRQNNRLYQFASIHHLINFSHYRGHRWGILPGEGQAPQVHDACAGQDAAQNMRACLEALVPHQLLVDSAPIQYDLEMLQHATLSRLPMKKK